MWCRRSLKTIADAAVRPGHVTLKKNSQTYMFSGIVADLSAFMKTTFEVPVDLCRLFAPGACRNLTIPEYF